MPIAINAVAQMAGRTRGAWPETSPLMNGPQEDTSVDTDAIDGRPPADLPCRCLTPEQAELQRPACHPDAIEDAAGDDHGKASERDEDRAHPEGPSGRGRALGRRHSGRRVRRTAGGTRCRWPEQSSEAERSPGDRARTPGGRGAGSRTARASNRSARSRFWRRRKQAISSAPFQGSHDGKSPTSTVPPSTPIIADISNAVSAEPIVAAGPKRSNAGRPPTTASAGRRPSRRGPPPAGRTTRHRPDRARRP